TVLHVAVLADQDQLIVTAQHRVEPDTGSGLQPHPADHHRRIGDPGIVGHLHSVIAQSVFHRCSLMDIASLYGVRSGMRASNATFIRSTRISAVSPQILKPS